MVDNCQDHELRPKTARGHMGAPLERRALQGTGSLGACASLEAAAAAAAAVSAGPAAAAASWRVGASVEHLEYTQPQAKL